jgi:NDP-4-keto-2,6-dideoxyhexose 3-C-methyltransferase
VDNFCAEHLTYFTLLSLETLLNRHGLEVIDLSTSMVNGGSLRTVVALKGAYEQSESVKKQRALELQHGLDELATYQTFSETAQSNLTELKELVAQIKAEDKKVAILAASTRGATIWQACDFGPDQISYAVERNPEKVGKYFNAIHVPIISEEDARVDNPDYMIIGPWFFAKEIIEREADYISGGGKLIVPLPKIQIIG